MGLFKWLWRLFFLTEPASRSSASPAGVRPKRSRKRRPRPKLGPFRGLATRRRFGADRDRPVRELVVPNRPYPFARPCVLGGWFDFSRDQEDGRLARFGLPAFRTPHELAAWLGISAGRLAWLVHRFDERHQPASERAAHYHFRWVQKRSGSRRLIESPKPTLRAVQQKILAEILGRVPPHPAANGFVAGRSIRTNAEPHLGQRVVVKFDLENFYPSVSFSRVVAIFRSLGYSREAGIWLARLCTSAVPGSLSKPGPSNGELAPYLRRHLPQGAPTSPALANLSAFALDLRLAGLARSFRANYTRYADDLTFSGDEVFLKSLAVFIPLVTRIIKSERFRSHPAKRRVVRSGQQQKVAGVVVNQKPNVPRRDYDRLKAILTNCLRRGPSTQNHTRHADFASHLRGRIAHVAHLNPPRGAKLLALFEQIDWKA